MNVSYVTAAGSSPGRSCLCYCAGKGLFHRNRRGKSTVICVCAFCVCADNKNCSLCGFNFCPVVFNRFEPDIFSRFFVELKNAVSVGVFRLAPSQSAVGTAPFGLDVLHGGRRCDRLKNGRIFGKMKLV